MVRVLTEPKNALVKQYQALFAMENAELGFTEAALRAIAERAMEKDTGARALRSIIEEVMLDIMFELPDQGTAAATWSPRTSSRGASRCSRSPSPRTKARNVQARPL